MRSKINFFSTSFLLIFLSFFLSIYPQISAAAITVPDVVNQPEPVARSTIITACDNVDDDDGTGCLTVGAAVNLEFSATIVGGNVTRQNPTVGTSVPANTAVNLFVSNRLVVPDVVGASRNSAEITINSTCVPGYPAQCLKSSVTQQASSTVPAGNVISQDPIKDFFAPAGSTVNLFVSSGPALLTVPDVVGKPETEARAQITSTCVTGITQCLTVGDVNFQTSETVAAGSVISQNPLGDVQVLAGTAVNLVVSSGRAPVPVPNVVGQPLASARTVIEGAELKVGPVTLQASASVPAGNVISQNPAAGAQVAPATAVNLVVSSGTEAPTPPPVTGGDIPVPDVKGLTKTAAADILRSVGLSVGATRQRFDDTAPAGIVVDQSPAAGAKVAVATPVTLTVSLGPAGVRTIPDVSGQLEAVAQSNLQNAGFSVGGTLRQPDPTMAPGNVIRTEPAAGTQADIGSAVTLIVSEGFSQPQQVAVPDVTGKTVEDAREILFAVGLFRVGGITVQRDLNILPGLVSGQVPAAETPVAYGTTINLFVSSGAQEPVVTPTVVGLTLDEATATIEATGLQRGFVTRQTSNTVEEGRVISQNPLMTALVPVGWEINLVVSLGPIPEDPGARPQTSVPEMAGLTLAEATARLIQAGLQVGQISNDRSPDVPVGQVIRQSPSPDPEATLPVGSRVDLVVSFGPFAYSLLSGPAYITNYFGNTASILNPDSNSVADNIPTGIDDNGPSGVAVHPDGTRLYVANRPRFGRRAGTVSVIDLTDRRVIAVIPVGLAPLGIAIDPTGERLFVANEGSFSLTVINTRTNQPFVDLNVPNLAANPFPRGVATHPNPMRPLVYVTNRTVNSFSDDEQNPLPDQCDALVARPPVNVNHDQCVGSLSIFDADIKAQVGSVAVGWAPEGVAVHPDGQLVYVANSGDRTVSVIETVFNRVVGIITLDEFGGAPQLLAPRGVAVSPDGNRLYVTDGAGDRLFVIDTTANHAVVGIVPVGRNPYGVSVSPDSRRVYVANTGDHTVSMVDGRSNEVIAVVPVGLAPWAFGQFVGPLATVAPPTFDPPGGPYRTGSLPVTLTTTTPGATIWYTTDGSTPTPTSGTPINSGESIVLDLQRNPAITLKAIAYKENWAASGVTEARYILAAPQGLDLLFGR